MLAKDKSSADFNSKVSWLNNPKYILAICLACIAIYSFYYFPKAKFDDSSLLGGDEWEYQSMGVNYATGHGFPYFGCVEPFEKYKMTRAWDQNWYNYYYSEFLKEKGTYRFYRTPGYPYFLGIIYKTFGISPKKAKQAQLLLLILISAFLPFLGWYYWKTPGLLSGLIGGVLYLNKYYKITSDLMTESLISFMIAALVFLFIWHNKKHTIISSIVFGISLGLALLVKGSLIYLVPLFLLYFIYQIIKKRHTVLSFVIVLASVIITIAPWSYFATSKEGKTVVLSTQGDKVMLEGNNEATFKEGGWHPEAVRDNPNSFYSKPEIKDLSATSKIIKFYTEHLDKIPIVIYNKIVAGFEEFIYLKVAFLLIIFELMINIFPFIQAKKMVNGMNEQNWKWIALAFTIVVFAVAFKAFALILIAAILGVFNWTVGKIEKSTLPASFLIIFLNFFILTVMVFGYPRFIYVADFLFILVALRYAWLLVETLFSSQLKFAQINTKKKREVILKNKK